MKIVSVPVYCIPLTTLAMPFRIRGFGTVQFPYTIGGKIDLHCTMFLQGRRAVVYRYMVYYENIGTQVEYYVIR